MASPSSPTPASRSTDLGLRSSGHFPEWLAAAGISLVFTTYQTNRLFFVGLTPDGRLSGFERLFDRPMGLHATPDRLTMATRYQIRELVNVLPPDETHEGYDRVYVPRRTHVTGALDAHDVHRAPDGEILFVNTRYSCLARPSDTHSFRPVWQPPFLSSLVPEDRCHLNGLATDSAGRPRFVTAVSRSDVAAAWRDRREDGGIVIDVETGEIVADGLSMPHSPRLHEGDLYLVNAGTGELGRLDRDTGTFDPIAFCPGYGRGLAFHDGYALVGLSKPRRSRTFQGLALDDALRSKDVDPKCGLFVIELSTGRTAHWMEFTSIIEEIYDVQVLPGVRRPMALGFKSDEIQRFITMETDDGPVQHRIALDDAPAASEARPEAEGDGAPAEASLPTSLELPRPATGGRRLSGHRPYRLEVTSFTARQAIEGAAPLLPGRFKRQVRAGLLPPEAPLIGVLARHGTDLIGVSVAAADPDAAQATVHAVGVLPDFRGQGLGTALLARLEDAVRSRGAECLAARYRSTVPGAAAIERLFEKRRWQPPTRVRRLYGGRRDRVTAPFRDRLSEALPRGTAFPWTALSPSERQDIQRRLKGPSPAVPRALSPFQMPGRIEADCSLGVRHEDRVAGWMITHRAGQDVLQFTCLYVAPDLRGAGTGPALLGMAIRRYLDETDRPRCVWMVDADKKRMQRYVERRLAAVIDSTADEIAVRKPL